MRLIETEGYAAEHAEPVSRLEDRKFLAVGVVSWNDTRIVMAVGQLVVREDTLPLLARSLLSQVEIVYLVGRSVLTGTL